MKATTLRDYEKSGLPEPEDFFEENGHLDHLEYRSRLSETYGSAANRSPAVKGMVNEAVMLYLLQESGG